MILARGIIMNRKMDRLSVLAKITPITLHSGMGLRLAINLSKNLARKYTIAMKGENHAEKSEKTKKKRIKQRWTSGRIQ